MNNLPLYYDTLKILHIISSAVLFGTGMGTALYMVFAHFQKDLSLRAKAYAQVVFADWLFTTPSAIFQALSGLTMIYINGYVLNYSEYQWHIWWVQGSVLVYVLAGLCWLPVLYLQTSMQRMVQKAATHQHPLPRKYISYFRTWFLLGLPAFISLIYVFYLMSARPISLGL